MGNDLQIIDERQLLGKNFRMYGTYESPLFLAKDVAEWIEYNPNKVNEMVAMVDDSEKLTETISWSGQGRKMWFLTEDGLYEVLMQSRMPAAKEFKKQVKQILKDVRKHGMYVKEDLLDNPDLLLDILTKYRDERKKRQELEQTNTILMHVNKTYTATEIAKELGFASAMALNKELYDLKIQFKQNDTYVLYSKYADKGYVEIKQEVLDNGKAIYHRRWTQLGREFLLKVIQEKIAI
ncbi:phage antirepressor KilAC domain-containing protein [Clostridium swellfunianum]|uniref:BRO family protein n=1 Tax=Clostridium swellfunianum TaxID=1367462 RepID=UPI00202EC696|nr:phage antirepressor KilAC domain-containing protein [Clostridium swellfunianum]